MLSREIKAQIARSYYLGIPPSCISRDHGIPAGHVIMIAKRHDLAMFEANRRRTPKPRREALRPVVRAAAPVSAEISEDRYYVVREGVRISLPMVSILRKRA